MNKSKEPIVKVWDEFFIKPLSLVVAVAFLLGGLVAAGVWLLVRMAF